MAKIQVKEELRRTGGEKKLEQREFEKNWRSFYMLYKYLCKIKHPTVRCTLYEAFGAHVGRGLFPVMAVPDVRQEDLAMKAMILTISIARCCAAMDDYARAMDAGRESATYREFEYKVDDIREEASRAQKDTAKTPLPFNISDSNLAKEWASLKRDEL